MNTKDVNPSNSSKIRCTNEEKSIILIISKEEHHKTKEEYNNKEWRKPEINNKNHNLG